MQLEQTQQTQLLRNDDEEATLSIDHIFADRRIVWRDIITIWAETFRAEIPTGQALYAKIISFDLVCLDVPTDKLLIAFMSSLKRRDNRGNLVFWDVRYIADEYLENDSLRKAPANSLGPGVHTFECKKCFGTGLEVVPGNGARRCEVPQYN